MSISATIAVNPSSVVAGRKFTVTATVTNTNTAAVNVTGIDASITPTGRTEESTPASSGSPPLFPGNAVSVAANGGTLALAWDSVIFAPTNGAALVWDIGATILTSDGSITTPTVTTVTTTAPPSSATL